MKASLHVYRQFTPSLFPGNYDWEILADTFGRPPTPKTRTPAQAVAAMLGLKVTPMTADDIKLSHLRRHEVIRNKLIGNWNRDIADEPRSWKIAEINQKYLRKLNKLDEEHLKQLRLEPTIGTPKFMVGEAKRFIIP